MGEAAWLSCRWGDLGVLEYGRALRDYKEASGSVRVYGTNGPVGWTDSKQGSGPIVVVGRKGAYRGVHYSAGSFWVIDTAYWLRLTAEVDVRWAYYQLLAQDINSLDSGSAIPSLSRADFSGIEVTLPPLLQQRAIAEVLGALDDKIEANRCVSKRMRELGDAIFLSSFGGETQEEWELRPFGHLIQDDIGGDWGKESPDGEYDKEVAVIRGTDLPDVLSGGPVRTPIRFIKSSSLAKRQLRPGDIVVEVSGGSPTQPTGRSLFVTRGVLDRLGAPVICASFCRRLRPLTFEHGLLASAHLANLYARGGTWEYQLQSTGIANFQTKDFLHREMVVWPSIACLGEFARTVEPLARSTSESLNLIGLRDVLLPKLLSGEVRVRDDDELVGEPV